MKIKMIVTDLDGTFLRSDKTVSEYSMSIIEKCRNIGIQFVIATARPVRAVEQFLPFIKYESALFHNGAVIKVAGKQIGKFGIKEPANLILKILHDFPELNIAVEMNDQLYANFDPSNIWKDIKYITTDFNDLPESEGDKILIRVTSIEEMEPFKAYISDELYIQLSENTVGMIMNKNASKINGIKAIAEIFNIQLSDVVAFGDDYNDIEMLQLCGVGVAVQNALEEVKKVCDDVCETNDSDGIAKWLETHVLGTEYDGR